MADFRPDRLGRRVSFPPVGLPMARGCISSQRWKDRATCGASAFPTDSRSKSPLALRKRKDWRWERDGRSVIASIGVQTSAIWIHDDQGERSLSSEGEIEAGPTAAVFTADNKTLYYLLRRAPVGSGPELWRMTIDSGKSEAVFPGISMLAYDVSPDEKQVVYAKPGRDGKPQLWLAPIDRSSAPKQIGQSGETWPFFGPRGKLVFQAAEGNANYLEEMNEDGSGRAKVVPYPIVEVLGISPGRKWVMGLIPHADGKSVGPMDVAIPLDGGPPVRICASYCLPTWSSSGRFLFIAVEAPSQTGPGRSLAIPVDPEVARASSGRSQARGRTG